jgi:hypothetical protein
MQTDDDIGKLATATPFLMCIEYSVIFSHYLARAIEVFVKRLVEQAIAIQREDGSESITLTVFNL